VWGAEVGDDRVDVSNHPTFLSTLIAVQELVYEMRTSEKDTAISDWVFNFCEVFSPIPHAKDQSFDAARKKNFHILGFSDAPALRIVIDA